MNILHRFSAFHRTIVTLASMGLMVALIVTVSSSTFTGTTVNPDNSVGTGTVSLTDSQSGTAMFSVTNADGGSVYAKCINVTYTGSIDVNAVKIYGAYTDAQVLAGYLTVKVERGTGSTNIGCTGFTLDGSTPTHFNALLNTFPASYAAGIDEGAWTTSDVHSYRFTVTVTDNNLAQNKTISDLAFTWEARNA